MSGFSIDWLQLREPADNAARDRRLLDRILGWLPAKARVVDLGSGTGSTLRALQQAASREYHWRLLDIDAVLLAEAQRRHGATHSLETVQTDINQVEHLPLQDADLVSASALFDLVSQTFVQHLCARLATHKPAFYAALNYDGVMRWEPVHPLDAAVSAAFNMDQRRDKGFGPALGPEATQALRAALEGIGYAVMLADSPWQLGPEQEALARELFPGIAAAVRDTLGEAAVQDWLTFRLAHAGAGYCFVGHQDILALPLNPSS